jgi:hypothetical protein
VWCGKVKLVGKYSKVGRSGALKPLWGKLPSPFSAKGILAINSRESYPSVGLCWDGAGVAFARRLRLSGGVVGLSKVRVSRFVLWIYRRREGVFLGSDKSLLSDRASLPCDSSNIRRSFHLAGHWTK